MDWIKIIQYGIILCLFGYFEDKLTQGIRMVKNNALERDKLILGEGWY